MVEVCSGVLWSEMREEDVGGSVGRWERGIGDGGEWGRRGGE